MCRVSLLTEENLILYTRVKRILTAALTTIKAYQNLAIVTKKAKYNILGIKDFYLNFN